MPVVVIEGSIGVGKTTVALEVARQIHCPVYRAFRPLKDLTDDHEPGQHDVDLQALKAEGLPVNSWQEDIYIADALATTRPTVVLDRSLPSGLVWSGGMLSAAAQVAALRLWARKIAAARGILVLLRASDKHRAERVGRDRFRDGEQAQITQYVRSASHSGQMKLVELSTEEAHPYELARAIVDVASSPRLRTSW